MKKTSWIALLGVAALAMPFAVNAEETAPKPKKPKPSQVEKLDTDKDGKVSVEEYAAPSKAKFKKMDRDGDGFLVAEEFKKLPKASKKDKKVQKEATEAATGTTTE